MSIKGFDYREQRQVTRSRDTWQNALAALIADGGRRRVEHGETFGHAATGEIAFEIYANVPLQSVDDLL